MSYRVSEWTAEDETNLMLVRVVEELCNIAESNRQIVELLTNISEGDKQ